MSIFSGELLAEFVELLVFIPLVFVLRISVAVGRVASCILVVSHSERLADISHLNDIK
jgi:hypothetical protein